MMQKSVLGFCISAWQKRGFANLLKCCVVFNRFALRARHPDAHSARFSDGAAVLQRKKLLLPCRRCSVGCCRGLRSGRGLRRRPAPCVKRLAGFSYCWRKAWAAVVTGVVFRRTRRGWRLWPRNPVRLVYSICRRGFPFHGLGAGTQHGKGYLVAVSGFVLQKITPRCCGISRRTASRSGNTASLALARASASCLWASVSSLRRFVSKGLYFPQSPAAWPPTFAGWRQGLRLRAP